MAFYCNGKKDICECDILCADCQHYDNTGGKNWQTNADRIRAMSDEELYLFAKKQIGCGFDFFPCGIVCDGKCKSFSEEDCREKIMNWLKQPAEET